MRRRGRPPIEPSRELVHLYKSQRLTAAEIARRLFMSESAVYRHLRVAGVATRRPGPRSADERG